MATEADTAARAAAIESELQTSIDEAKVEVADEARSDEEKRAAQERLDNLENRLRSVESERANVTPAVPVVDTPPVAPPDDPISRLEGKIDAFMATVAKPVEPVKDAAEAALGAVADVADDAKEVVETVPTRTHGMFKKVFGGGRDG